MYNKWCIISFVKLRFEVRTCVKGQNRKMVSLMNKFLVKSTIIIPMAIIYIMLFCRALNIYIRQINLYINYSGYIFLTIIFMVAWFAFAPLSRSCRKGNILEIMYNLIPVEFALMPMFWERHFVIALLLVVLTIGIEIKIALFICKKFNKEKLDTKLQKKRQSLFYRLSVIGIFFVYLIPSAISAFIYDFRPREYFSPDNMILYIDDSDKTNEENDVYKSNADFISAFDNDKWMKYSIEEKITMIQNLADFESNILHIPKVTVCSKKIDRYTLGMYDRENNTITVDVQHLNCSDAKKCINTISHEIFHAYQYQLVENFDWDSEMADTYYYNDLKEWKNNQQNYKNAFLYGYDDYSEQAIEKSAREYAAQETDKIMKYLADNSGR